MHKPYDGKPYDSEKGRFSRFIDRTCCGLSTWSCSPPMRTRPDYSANLAFFAGLSYLFTVWLIAAGGGFPKLFLWIMEHFLIATTMVAVNLFRCCAGILSFLTSAMFLVLAALPIRANTLSSAKLTALIAVLSLSVVSLNIFTGLVWPFLFSATNGGGYAAPPYKDLFSSIQLSFVRLCGMRVFE